MNQSPKRLSCLKCTRPLQNCICACIRECTPHIELLILQHPLEVNNAKNTAGLLHLSVKNSRLLIGEKFDDTELNEALLQDNKTPLLLYPQTPEHQALGLLPSAKIPTQHLATPEQLRLIVLDGSWRKSRKMLYLNASLQALPRISLESPPPSLYSIRKAQAADQLSTFEASCYALHQLEHLDYTELIRGFSQFVAQQSLHMPK
jgi:DTW domain-containing protein YfiP